MMRAVRPAWIAAAGLQRQPSRATAIVATENRHRTQVAPRVGVEGIAGTTLTGIKGRKAVKKTRTSGQDTKTPGANRRSNDGEKSSPRPDKSGGGSPDLSQSTKGGGSDRRSGTEQGASQRTHKERSTSPSASDERLPEAERIRESDGPHERERAEARRDVPFRDGPSDSTEPDREVEKIHKRREEDRLEDDRSKRKEAEA
jgi:hypothetical protein